MLDGVSPLRLLVCCINVWSVKGGSSGTDSRGHTLLEAFSILDIILANSGDLLTFHREGTGSIMNLIFVSSCLARTGINWEVGEHYKHSDHQTVLSEVMRGPGSWNEDDCSQMEGKCV